VIQTAHFNGGNLKSIVFAIALLLLTGLAAAEEKLTLRTVRVVGTSEVKVVPDRAVINVGMEKQNPSARLAKQGADEAARRLLDELHANGVEEKDIQTTFLSLQPQFNYRHGMKMSYFVAEQTLSVTIRDLSKLDSIFEALIKAGANRIDSIEYESSDLRKYRDQARDLAVKAAREKAQALAAALDQTIGKAVSIEEVPQSADQYSTFMSNATFENAKLRQGNGPTTSAGEKTISASVIVAFDLN
jgi:uncharacterized protein